MTRGARRWLLGIVGAAGVAFELSRAPIILFVTFAIVLATVLTHSRYTGSSVTGRRRASIRAVELGALLSTGLWMDVFLVVKFADSSADSPIPATFPIGFDGEEVGVMRLLIHGLFSTATTAVLTLGVLMMRNRDATRSSSRSRHRQHRHKDPHSDRPPAV